MAVPRIIVGFHSTGTCPTLFAMDLSRAMRYSGTIVPLAIHEQGCYVDSARNKIVRQFLAMRPEDATHLLMLDVDLSFSPDAFLKTHHIFASTGADVLYGNYALGNSGNSVFGPPENAANEAAVLVKLVPNQVYSDIGTGGTGWVMMSRAILERMQKECTGPWHWFDRDLTAAKDDKRGEDVTFGLRLWKMDPRPKVYATTHILLRHLKTQPFIPDFMTKVAEEEHIPAMAMPNPYENDPEHYEVVGHSVIHKKLLTPEQVAQLQKEKEDALRRGHGEVQEGEPAQRVEVGKEGDQPQAGDSHNAVGEASGGGGQEGVPAEEGREAN